MDKPLSVRIRQIRQSLGETQGEFARRFKVKQASVSRWESGAMPDPPALAMLADLAGETVMAFLGGEGDTVNPGPAHTIPILGEVPGGNWREAVRHSRMSMPAPDPSVPPNSYALKVVGDSMDKLVKDGATIIIDPDDDDLYPGELYVVRNGDGEATFKQYLDSPGRLVPCSNNPDHQVIPIKGSSDWKVLGRVIWIAMRPRYAALD